MALRTTFKERNRALNLLTQDERALRNLSQELEDLYAKLKGLRLTSKEFESARLLGKFLDDAKKLVEEGKSVTEQSQKHVTASFTPLEELMRGEEEEAEVVPRAAKIPEQAEQGETVLSLRLLPLILVIHVIKTASVMQRSVLAGSQDAETFEKAMIDVMKDDNLGSILSQVAAADDVGDTVDIINTTVGIYNAITEQQFTEDLIRGAEEVSEDEVVNQAALTAFFVAYLGNMMRLLSPVETRSAFRDALNSMTVISDVEGLSVYRRLTSAQQRQLVNAALSAASNEVYEKSDPRLEGTEEQKTWLQSLTGMAGAVFNFLRPAPEIKAEPMEEEEEEEEVEEEERARPKPKPKPRPKVEAKPKPKPKPEPVVLPDVDNVVAPGEGSLFQPLYNFAVGRIDQDNLDFATRYKAITYAAALLKTPEDVEAFMQSDDMADTDGEPDYAKLFKLLNALSVGFLAQKQPERVQIPGIQETQLRYEIDIDVRPPRPASDILPFRGMTDLDANIVQDAYLTYIVPIRASLRYFTNILPQLGELTDDELRAIDRFMESQFRFPYPLFNIGGISESAMRRLQQKALSVGEEQDQFEPSDDPLPPIDRSPARATNTDVPIRFRMYKTASKSPDQTADPINLLRLLSLIQAERPNVFDPKPAVAAAVPLDTDLSVNWFTNALISLAKLILPSEGKNKLTAFQQNANYHTIQLFAFEDELPEDELKQANYILFKPSVAEAPNKPSGQTLQTYKNAQRAAGLKPLVSRSKAQRAMPSSSHKKGKKKEMKNHDKEWKQISCEISEAITSKDSAALATALRKAEKKLQAEIDSGKAMEHLREHIEMLREKMQVAGNLGLGGGEVMLAIKAVSSACSRCPACKRGK